MMFCQHAAHEVHGMTICCHWLFVAHQVAVGCDPRVSGPLLVPAVLAGLMSAGAAAVDVGLSTTPAMFYGIIAPGEHNQGVVP